MDKSFKTKGGVEQVEEHFPNGSKYRGDKRGNLRHGRGRFTY